MPGDLRQAPQTLYILCRPVRPSDGIAGERKEVKVS